VSWIHSPGGIPAAGAYIRARSWSDGLVTEAYDQGGCSDMHDSVPTGTLVEILWVVLYRIYVLHL